MDGDTLSKVETVNVQTLTTEHQHAARRSVATENLLTLQANVAFTLPSAVAGKSLSVGLVQDGTGGRTPTFSGVKWAGGSAPTFSAEQARRTRSFSDCDNGSTWEGYVVGLDVRWTAGRMLEAAAGGVASAAPWTTAVTYSGPATATANSGGLQVTMPSGIQAGDFAIIYAITGQAGAPNGTPAGFTQLAQTSGSGGAIGIYYKVLTGTETTAISFPLASTFQSPRLWAAAVFRGVHPTDPLDAASTGIVTNVGSPLIKTWSAPSVTPNHRGHGLRSLAGGQPDDEHQLVSRLDKAHLECGPGRSLKSPIRSAYDPGPASSGTPTGASPFTSSDNAYGYTAVTLCMRPA